MSQSADDEWDDKEIALTFAREYVRRIRSTIQQTGLVVGRIVFAIFVMLALGAVLSLLGRVLSPGYSADPDPICYGYGAISEC